MPGLLLLALMGTVGVLARVGLDASLSSAPPNDFPASTFAINVLGSALAGIFYALAEQAILTSSIQAALLVGFCGGLTTFSAFSLQLLQMIERGKILPALAYITLSPICGLLSAFLAVFFTRRLVA